MLSKPPHGSPCNNCGLCCAEERCLLGQIVFGAGGRCPALQMRLPGFVCGLVDDPARYAPSVVQQYGAKAARNAAAYLIGAGKGCDSQLADEPYNFAWAASAKRQPDPALVVAAFDIWRSE